MPLAAIRTFYTYPELCGGLDTIKGCPFFPPFSLVILCNPDNKRITSNMTSQIQKMNASETTSQYTYMHTKTNSKI
jgi:hypothetical protein